MKLYNRKAYFLYALLLLFLLLLCMTACRGFFDVQDASESALRIRANGHSR